MKRFNNVKHLRSEAAMQLGFTLAEVLITLSIIGVVAALTIPSLIQNHRKQEVETKLAKVYSVMNQAINLAKVEYGDFDQWADFEPVCGAASAPICTSEQAMEIFNQYIGKHIKYTKEITNNETGHFFVYFSDGSILAVRNIIRDMIYYTNQKALDNSKAGVNTFSFRFAPADERDIRNKFAVNKGFEPYTWSWNGTLEDLTDNSSYGCNTSTSGFCTKLIQINGWKIPKNYPKKF